VKLLKRAAMRAEGDRGHSQANLNDARVLAACAFVGPSVGHDRCAPPAALPVTCSACHSVALRAMREPVPARVSPRECGPCRSGLGQHQLAVSLGSPSRQLRICLG
jgi:hypothetical protein